MEKRNETQKSREVSYEGKWRGKRREEIKRGWINR